MHITINHVSQFRDAFHHAGRKYQFSYDALGILYEYLEEREPSYDLDVVDLCCTYAESTLDDLIDNYSIDVDGVDDKLQAVIDFINDHSVVLGVTSAGHIVHGQF
jgi:hypothetical protein